MMTQKDSEIPSSEKLERTPEPTLKKKNTEKRLLEIALSALSSATKAASVPENHYNKEAIEALSTEQVVEMARKYALPHYTFK